ncbi:hypothetical protein LCGC14_3148550 [marine sediment metagenome]|uniref:Uncharacterized protein n=1 Tax=marine sediment metagenome TaxID=412755 RepID=A0A0F8VUR8_9ZZZZ
MKNRKSHSTKLIKNKKMTKIFNTSRLQDLGILAAFVVVLQVALSKWIYPLFNSTTEQLFAITQQTAITSPTIGNKVIGVLTGIIPFNLGALTE